MPKIPMKFMQFFKLFLVISFCLHNTNLYAEEELREVTLLGPEVFVRDSGSPQVVSLNFFVPISAASYRLKVQNGSQEGENQISSAVVTLNGNTIISQKDFNQNDSSLEKSVPLQNENRLEVKLNSIPSSYITITIVGYYPPEDLDDDGDGYSENQGDCDDNDSTISPGADEACDGVDNDCDTQADEGVLNDCGECGSLPDEVCDSIDNNCNGVIDEGCAQEMSLAITYPKNESKVYRDTIEIYGTFSGNPSSIFVNDLKANTHKNNFAAMEVPVNYGKNTITAKATDVAGNTVSSSITVNAITQGDYIRIFANVESGIPPLETTLKVDGSFSFSNSSTDINYTGPGPVELSYDPNFDVYVANILEHGIYTFTAEVRDSENKQYTDSIEINVQNKQKLDSLLKSRWEGMKQKLANQDVEGALEYFLKSSKEKYQYIFTSLLDKLPDLVSKMREVEMISTENGIAECRISRLEDVGEVTYYIYFFHDEDGLWKIQQF
jgi:hypothetical protein